MRSRRLLLAFVLIFVGCVGMGAAIQDASIPAGGAAAGAGTAVAVGFSGGLVALLAGLGAAVGSLIDQAAEGQTIQAMGLDQLAPFGLGALFSALFWPVLAIILALWLLPQPHRIVIRVWRLVRRVGRDGGKEVEDEPGVELSDPRDSTD